MELFDILILLFFVVIGSIFGVLLERNDASKQSAQLRSDIQDARLELTRLEERENSSTRLIEERNNSINDLTTEINSLRPIISALETDISKATERENNLRETIKAKETQLDQFQEKLRTEFENIATSILDKTTEKISAKSDDTLERILKPFKDRISEFQTKVESTHQTDIRERATLIQKIEEISRANLLLSSQAEGLTKALRGDSQKRGQWGELKLEKILESSGLERGREFIIQGEGLKLKSEDGKNQRPDVIILLPEGKHLVVDSKVSLNSYQSFASTEDENDRKAYTSSLVSSIYGHVNDLSSKEYQYNQKINAHECVLMFVPIEGALAVALRQDEGIFEYAWKKGVVIVTPSTLIMTIKTIETIWRLERQNENAIEIANQAGALYDKICSAMEDIKSVGEKLDQAKDAHDSAVKRLHTGRGNALSKAEKLRNLGGNIRKTLPKFTLDGEPVEIENEPDDEMRPLAHNE